MKKTVIIALHTFYWLGYIFLVLAFCAIMFGIQQAANPEAHFFFTFANYVNVAGLTLLPAVLTFYGTYFYLFDRLLKKKRYGLLILSGYLLSAFSIFIAFCVISLFSGSFFWLKDGIGAFVLILALLALIPFIQFCIAVMIRGFISWFEESRLRKEIQQKNEAIELELVKARLNPHFLFNTLNNIDELILKNPVLASEYLVKLSDMLRTMLYEHRTQKISLQDDIAYIQQYLDLQKIRISREDCIDFRVRGDMEHVLVSPMLFLPFIENAFKYYDKSNTREKISLELKVSGKQLEFLCRNPYHLHVNALPASPGIGNELIEKRISLLYPGYKLARKMGSGVYEIHLSLPLDA